MPRHLIMLVIGLFFGAGAGFLVAAANDVTLSGHDHSAHGVHDDAGVDHSAHAGRHDKMVEHPSDLPAPTIALQISPEGKGAWNLQIVTKNFCFAPEHVNGDMIPGEGHAHIYVDGVKLARIYGPWFHLSGLAEDAKEVRVTLNANSHEALAVNGEPIEARVSIASE